MKTDMNTVVTNETTQERLAWHQPEIKRLTVSMDTAFDGGSGIDGIGQSQTNP